MTTTEVSPSSDGRVRDKKIFILNLNSILNLFIIAVLHLLPPASVEFWDKHAVFLFPRSI